MKRKEEEGRKVWESLGSYRRDDVGERGVEQEAQMRGSVTTDWQSKQVPGR